MAILAAGLMLIAAAHADDRVRPITRIAPDYPPGALDMEIAGRVRASLVVDETGTVTAVEITSESPQGFGFGAAAKVAFSQWIYPRKVPGTYKAVFTFAVVPLGLTAEEADLPFSAPPVSRVRMKYPEKGMSAGAGGGVLVIAIVGATGKVESVRAQKESPPGLGFAEAAIAAVSNWRFAPGERSVYPVTAKFRMEADGDDQPPEIALPDDLPPAPEPSRAGTPDYPYKARQAGVEGVVELGIQIDKRGRITHAGLLSEKPSGHGFAESAYKALQEWRFSGAAPGTYKLIVAFKLE